MQKNKQEYYAYYYNKKLVRLKGMLITLHLAIGFLFINELIFTTFNPVEVALLLSLGFYGFLYYWAEPDTVDIVIGLTLWSITILACYFAWINSGLLDSALIVFPCVLMLSFFLGSALLSVPLYLFMMAMIGFFLFAHHHHWISTNSFSLRSYSIHAVDLSITISFFSLVTFFFVKDMKKAYIWISKKNILLEEQISTNNQLIYFNSLTHLPNEHRCEQLYPALLASINNTSKSLAVMSLDVHNFREINNTLGHDIGDLLLTELSTRLLLLEKEQASIFHFKAAELVIIKRAQNQQALSMFQEQLIQALSLPFQVNDYEIELFTSIGIAIAPTNGTDLNELLQKAHLTLHQTANKKVNSYHFYDSSITEQKKHDIELMTALKQALKNNEFELFYQGRVDLVTEQIVAAEAQIKWHRPGFSTLLAKEFIHSAETSGLITELNKWAINQACQTCAHWHQQGYDDLTIAVNLSAIDFRRGNLPHIVFKALQEHKLDARFLTLTINESVITDDIDHIKNQLRKLHAKGIRLAIDNFGYGYSNIHVLSQFNISIVKIAPSLINQLLASEPHQQIVKSLVQLSHSIGFINIGDDVENKQTCALLKSYGCDLGQGNFWSPALTKQNFEKTLNSKEIAHIS